MKQRESEEIDPRFTECVSIRKVKDIWRETDRLFLIQEKSDKLLSAIKKGFF